MGGLFLFKDIFNGGEHTDLFNFYHSDQSSANSEKTPENASTREEKVEFRLWKRFGGVGFLSERFGHPKRDFRCLWQRIQRI